MPIAQMERSKVVDLETSSNLPDPERQGRKESKASGSDGAVGYKPAQQVLLFAEQLSREQDACCRQRLIYLNTLAVTTVGYHLSRARLAVDFKQSDSCGADSYPRRLFNVADLAIPGVGSIECRPVLPDQQIAVLPPEEAFDRVAIVLVEVDEDDQMVRILGFAMPNRKDGRLPLFTSRNRLYPARWLAPFLKQLRDKADVASAS